MVDCLTDNRTRTVAEVRHAFSKFGGNLGADGSVGYLFTQAGSLSYGPGADEDKILEVALEAGALDVVTSDDGSIEVVTEPEDFERVRDAMVAAKLVPDDAEVTMRAETRAPVELESAETLLKLIDMLEDLDDVQQVYTNADIPDEALEATA
ncbi:MAG: YebC/PmpR family DNA-binding transcriptional regulator, partial [Gammaproteobacteria bacterium]|nr:YebC/PmpR family DNA-binding transcriptional regulator [Gammaproteobacteria bacterium]